MPQEKITTDTAYEKFVEKVIAGVTKKIGKEKWFQTVNTVRAHHFFIDDDLKGAVAAAIADTTERDGA